MSEIRYYKGVHRVRVVTKSEGYWIVEASEDFEDQVDEERVLVKSGERRIVPTRMLFKRKTLPPMIREHTYELQMERKLMRFIAKEENKITKRNKTKK